MSENTQLGPFMDAELTSQPEVWAQAIAQAKSENLLPADGQRVAVIGCGTSWFMAQSYAHGGTGWRCDLPNHDLGRRRRGASLRR